MKAFKIIFAFALFSMSAASKAKDVARLQSMLKSRLQTAAAEKAEAGVASSLRGKDNDCDESASTHWCPSGHCDGSGDKDSDDSDTSFDCQCLKYEVMGIESSAKSDCGKDCPDSTCTLTPLLLAQTLTQVSIVPGTENFESTTQVVVQRTCHASCDREGEFEMSYSASGTVSEEVNWDHTFAIGMEATYEVEMVVSTASVTMSVESSWSNGGASGTETGYDISYAASSDVDDEVVVGELNGVTGTLTCDISGVLTNYYSDGSTDQETWYGTWKGSGVYNDITSSVSTCYNYGCESGNPDLSTCKADCDTTPPASDNGKIVMPLPRVVKGTVTYTPKK